MKNIIYNMDPQGPDELLFTVGMKNLLLHPAPPSLSGSLVTILVPHIGQPIGEATCSLADLGSLKQ